MLALDHITVAALSVEEGVRHVEKALGVCVPPGGVHPLMGTRNHLMQLGPGLFLEVIAPDPELVPQRPRWFGLDTEDVRNRLMKSPQLLTWVVRVSNLPAVLDAIDEQHAESVVVTRGNLSWLISVPPDGALPSSGAFPSFIQWPSGPHPAEKMADLGCQLSQLDVSHPDANRISAALKTLHFEDKRVELSTGELALRATISTPRGVRTLS